MSNDVRKQNLAETERIVLSVLLNDSHAIVPVMEILDDPEDFAEPAHRQVFKTILTLTKETVVPNPVTVADRLNWPVEKLQEIAKGFTSKLNHEVLYYADIVAREAKWRRVKTALEMVQVNGKPPPGDEEGGIEGYVDWSMQMIAGTTERSGQRDPGIQAVARELDEEIKAIADGGMIGHPTGLDWLNERSAGFIPGHVWIVAAPYKGRKTTLARNFAIAICRAGGSVDWFAAEGSRPGVAAGLLGMLATDRLRNWGLTHAMNLSETFIRRGMRTPEQETALEDARKELDGFNLRIYDGRDRIGNAERIAHLVRRDRLLYGADAVIVDYLQLLGEGKLFDRMEATTHRLQALTQETGVTGIFLTQLNESTVWLMDDDSDTHYSPGVKGGGDVPAAADFLLVTRYRGNDPDNLTINLKLARHAQPVSWRHEIEPKSGLILREIGPIQAKEKTDVRTDRRRGQGYSQARPRDESDYGEDDADGS